MNVGRFQVLYWPRRRLWFWRPHYCSGIYSWILYVWPLELRRFAPPHDFRREPDGAP